MHHCSDAASRNLRVHSLLLPPTYSLPASERQIAYGPTRNDANLFLSGILVIRAYTYSRTHRGTGIEGRKA